MLSSGWLITLTPSSGWMRTSSFLFDLATWLDDSISVFISLDGNIDIIICLDSSTVTFAVNIWLDGDIHVTFWIITMIFSSGWMTTFSFSYGVIIWWMITQIISSGWMITGTLSLGIISWLEDYRHLIMGNYHLAG
jgi:hypothetical protein